MTTLRQQPGSTHIVNRKTLYDDVLQLYRINSTTILHEYPLKVAFNQERAIDCGGVSREMYSAFWEEAYRNLFDGSSLLIPITHKKSAMSVFSTLGCVLSHGYLVCGYIPSRIAFPSLACILLGMQVEVPDKILMNAFADSISPIEAGFIKGCLTITSSVFSSSCQDRLVSILSRFGTRELSSPDKLKEQIIEAAYREFMMKPMAAINSINSGIPHIHCGFWEDLSVDDLYSLYCSKTASPSKVIDMIVEPLTSNPAQERVFGYLIQYVGAMKASEVQHFLRLVTGSSVCTSKDIFIEFNTLSGLGRRPISHTCTNYLELSTNYDTYLDFETEFNSILSDTEYAWIMDGV